MNKLAKGLATSAFLLIISFNIEILTASELTHTGPDSSCKEAEAIAEKYFNEKAGLEHALETRNLGEYCEVKFWTGYEGRPWREKYRIDKKTKTLTVHPNS